jgi:hypothetical protein
MKRLYLFLACSFYFVTASDLACTKQQAVDVTTAIVNVAADVCQLAPQVLPPGTPAGSLVGLLCPLVSNPNQLVAVIVSAAGWESMKAELASRLKDAGK